MIGVVVYLAVAYFLRAEAEESGGAAIVQIYREDEWYRARPEVEKELSGILLSRDRPAGPAERTALRYTLITEGERIPVYAPLPSQQLDSFIGQPVVVYGKVVNLTDEGFGNELWIGSLRRKKL